MKFHYSTQKGRCIKNLAKLKDIFCDYVCPTAMKSNNASKFKGKTWQSTARLAGVQLLYTEPHHPKQNLTERRGGAIKTMVVHMIRRSDAPPELL